jgi:hypothetical protein
VRSLGTLNLRVISFDRALRITETSPMLRVSGVSRMQQDAEHHVLNITLLTVLMIVALTVRWSDITYTVTMFPDLESTRSAVQVMQAAPFWPVWLGYSVIVLAVFSRFLRGHQ